MICNTTDNQLSVLINEQEWKDIFELNDGEYVDVFIGDDNIDLFFPRWRDYVNPDNIIPNLNVEDASRFKKLQIVCDESVSDRSCEGIYDIIDYTIVPALDDEGDVEVVGIDDDKEMIVMITISFER